MLEFTDANRLKMVHRHTEDTRQTVEQNLATAIPKELKDRIYCGEKTIDTTGDIFSDGTPAYFCTSLQIDSTLVAKGGSIGLLDVAISPDNSTALIVTTENGKPQVYRVSLK